MYQKGELKREEILQAAKDLLYRQGYEATTIRQIADRCGAPVGLVHYYFKKKEDIVRAVYHDFHNAVDVCIYSHMPTIDDDIFLTHAVNNRIYYEIILSDENNRRLYWENLRRTSNARLIDNYAQNIYRKYLEQYQVAVPDSVYQLYIQMNFGARREVFLQYFEGTVPVERQELVSAVIGLMPRLLKLDHRYIDSILLQSLSIFNSIDYSHVRFLV